MADGILMLKVRSYGKEEFGIIQGFSQPVWTGSGKFGLNTGRYIGQSFVIVPAGPFAGVDLMSDIEFEYQNLEFLLHFNACFRSNNA